jgi:four helix bundle protein
MDQLRSHKNLVVWQKSIVFAGKVYAATRTLPSEDNAALRDDLRRAATLIASKISEGHARKSRSSFLRCLEDASSALSELETHVMIAAEQNYLPDSSLTNDIEEIAALLSAMVSSIRTAERIAHAKACAPSRYVRSPVG